jgi:hypothetical protein
MKQIARTACIDRDDMFLGNEACLSMNYAALYSYPRK